MRVELESFDELLRARETLLTMLVLLLEECSDVLRQNSTNISPYNKNNSWKSKYTPFHVELLLVAVQEAGRSRRTGRATIRFRTGIN